MASLMTLAMALLKKDGDDDFYFAKKKVNSKDYFFNNRGEMLSDFVNVVETDDASVIKHWYVLLRWFQ